MQAGNDFLFGKLLSFEVAHHQFFVRLRSRVRQLALVRLHLIGQLVGNIVGTQDTHDLAEICFRAHRDSHRDTGCAAVGFLNGFQDTVKIAVLAIETVDQDSARNVVLAADTPGARGTDLNATDTVNHDQCHVTDVQGRYRVAKEIRITRGVDEKEARVIPFAGHRRSIEAAPFLLLFGTVIGHTGLLVNAAKAGCSTRLEQDEGRQGGLTGTGVTGDGEIAYLFGWLVVHVLDLGGFMVTVVEHTTP